MLINLRNALMTGERLPYDAEVEFLESTGTQWIGTGVPLKFPISADITLAMVSPYGTLDSLPVFGFRYGGGSASSKFAIWFNKSQLRFALNYGSYDSGWEGSSVQSGQVVHLHTDGAKLYIDGSLIADGGTVTTTDTSNTLTLFQMRDASSVAARGQRVRYYACKIYDANGVLVRDFIPVRRGTTGYLYDRVSGKLFGNAGTGDFVLGPDVVPVEYIESTGAQRILTDIYTDANTVIKCKAIGTPGSFFGVLPSSSTAWWTILLDSGKLRYYYGGSGAIDVATIDATIPHDYQCSDKVLVDGVEVISLSRTLRSANVPLSLFARTASSGTSFTSLLVGRMWYLQIIQSGATVRSFRPVRVGTEGAMMDVLTRRIYRNAGTGAFTYGNDLKYPIPAE